MLFWRKYGYTYWIVVLVLILFEACNTKGRQESLDEKKNWSIEILEEEQDFLALYRARLVQH